MKSGYQIGKGTARLRVKGYVTGISGAPGVAWHQFCPSAIMFQLSISMTKLIVYAGYVYVTEYEIPIMASDMACIEINVDYDFRDDVEDYLADHRDIQVSDMTRKYYLDDVVCTCSCT